MTLDFFEKRKYRKTIKKLRAEIDKNSVLRPDLLLKIASLSVKLNKKQDAEEAYKTVINFYLSEHRLEQAEAVCKSVLEIFPENEEIKKIYTNLVKPETIQEPEQENSNEYDEEVEQLMDEWQISEEELTPVAQFSDVNPKNEEQWIEDSEVDARIPSPPTGTPSISMSLDSISEQFSRISSAITTITDNNPKDEVIDIFEDNEDTFFDSWEEIDIFEFLPFFSSLPEITKNEFRDILVPQKYITETTIIREGDTGTSLFVLLQGELRVSKLQPNGEDIVISSLKKGDVFGELAMLADQKRHATITAVKPSLVLEIPKEVIMKAGKKTPNVIKQIKEFYKQRLQEILISNLDFFKLIPEENRNKYFSNIHFRQFAPHTSIVKQNTKTGGFFLILLGDVEVVVSKDNKNYKVGVLSEGDFFGEIALIKRKPAMASVVSLNTVEIVQIPPKTFFQMLADYPSLWKTLNQVANKRELMDYYLLSGMGNKKLII